MGAPKSSSSAWPELPIADWQPTRDTLTLGLQVVGKVRIARTPLLKHWWNAPLYLTARGLTTSLMPAEPGRSFSIDLDFIDHRLDVTTTTGQVGRMELAPKSVADFYTEFSGAPNCGPHVMHEAYSHEVSSAGFWPGGEGEGIFLQKTYEAAAIAGNWDRASLERTGDLP